MNNYDHKPVLLKETLQFLALRQGLSVLDGTLGLGGHALAILECLEPKGHYYAFDLDQDNLKFSEKRLHAFAPQITFYHDSFVHCHHRLHAQGVSSVDRILLDLGLSSPHVDEPTRGFSFRHEGPLDMRFDRSSGQTAADVLNQYSESELKRIFYTYGEERYSPKVARLVIQYRREKPFESTQDLLALVSTFMKNPSDARRVCTRLFQALRIEVNDELGVLERVLPQLFDLLSSGGRLVIISYHSLEDRIVKHAFKSIVQSSETFCFKLLTKKPIVPSLEEIEQNPRSRSAKLRALEKI